jgi:uncharacterized coiled-coil protein SlyX
VSEDDRFIDLEVKLAYQERLIRDLDALVREFATRLAKAEDRLAQIDRPAPVVSERPPHY